MSFDNLLPDDLINLPDVESTVYQRENRRVYTHIALVERAYSITSSLADCVGAPTCRE